MEESRNVIELEHVGKDYGDFRLDDISFSVPEGSVCGFIGQNGAGKTTTIQLILDAIKRDCGDIRVFGESVDQDSARLRENIGVVFDEMGFHDFLKCTLCQGHYDFSFSDFYFIFVCCVETSK